jgi:hypothetical protein
MREVLSRLAAPVMALAALALVACSGTQFEPPDLQGAPLMAAVDGKPLLLVLTKQEERRVSRIGGGRSSSATERRDTLFHFDLRAYEPTTATPLWRARLVSFNDPKMATAARSTRIIGSATSGFLLGQEGDRVWLQIAESPLAVAVRDGRRLVDAAAIEAANPDLAGRLPSEARFYGFDRGLVVHAADARRWVLRGAALKAEPWAPAAPAAAPAPLKANGMPKVVPMLPIGDAPARLAVINGTRIGLYSPNEAKAAATDPFGDRLAYPYSILDEGASSRRSFWTVHTEQVRRFDERFEQIRRLEPVADSAVFLRGRFLKQLPGEAPLNAKDPDGVFVWHSSRMDDAGRLSLTRLDTQLKPLWSTVLPMSESGTANPVRYWLLGDRVVVMGQWSREIDHQVSRQPYLLSIALRDGTVLAHNLGLEPTDQRDPTKVPPRNGSDPLAGE